MKRKTPRTLIITIVLVAGFLRFYHLATMPPGLYWDEVSIGYNAYSILKTGQDEHGTPYPLLFKAFGEYKLPVYIYATAASLMLFGRTDFAVRFPSALAGTLTVLLTYFLTMELFGKKLGTSHQAPGTLAAIAALLLAISPWHLQFSRAGFEANLSLMFLVGGTLAFLRGIHSKQHGILLSMILFVLGAYTYNSARVFAPLLLLALVVIHRRELVLQKKQVFVAGLVGALMIIPMMVQVISGEALIRAYSEGIIRQPQPVTHFLSNYLENFNTDFLFFHGDQNGRHSVRKLGMLYVFELPLIILGLRRLLSSKGKEKALLITWLLLAPIPASLTRINPHALRSLNMLPIWHVVASVGVLPVVKWLRQWKSTWRYVAQGIVSVAVALNILLYLHQYFVHYRRETGLDWQDGLKETVEVISENYDAYPHIYVSDALPPLYLAYYLPLEPHEYRSLIQENQFGKLRYFAYASDIAGQDEKPSLIVAPFWQKPPERIPFREIEMVNGDVVFNIWVD